MKPDWLKLLELRKQKGFGLTLPFIYGAVHCLPTIFSEEEAQRTFEAVILSMRDEAPSGYQVRIHECGELHQPVAGIVYSPQPWCEGWPSPHKPETSLCISSEYIPEGAPIETAIPLLWSRCRDAIIARAYSFKGGVYCPFNATDLDFIKQAKHQEESEAD